MTILGIIDKASNSWTSIAALATIASVFAFLVFPRLTLEMNQDEAGPPPDLRYGYTSEELNAWYDAIGEDGCRNYKRLALLDLFPYMECYTLLFGGLIAKAARLAGQNPELALLMPVIMLCDVVETVIPAYGCFLYPSERLPTLLIHVSAAANRLKWTLFVVSNVVLSFLFFTSLLKAAVKKKEKLQKKKKETTSKKKK